MDFDRAASIYRKAHKENISFSGEEPDYFHLMKARMAADRLGGHGPGIKLLDYGCGLGLVTRHLKKLIPEAEIHGADPSAKSIGMASSENPGIKFTHLDGSAPYEAGYFDAVMLSCVLHHAWRDRGAVYGEVRRLLGTGKDLFVFEHNPFNPLTRRAVSTCVFDEDAKLISRRTCCAELEKAGFIIREAGYIVFFPGFLRRLRPFEKHMGWLPLGGQYFVRAAKT